MTLSNLFKWLVTGLVGVAVIVFFGVFALPLLHIHNEDLTMNLLLGGAVGSVAAGASLLTYNWLDEHL